MNIVTEGERAIIRSQANEECECREQFVCESGEISPITFECLCYVCVSCFAEEALDALDILKIKEAHADALLENYRRS